MANVKDQELAKFRNKSDKTFVAVTTEGDVSGLLSGVSYDDIQTTFPTSTTELYTYLSGGTTVAQVEVTYTNASKDNLLRVRRL